MKKNVDLIYITAGGGHKASAEALKASIEMSYDWNIRLIDLREILEPVDWVKKYTGISIENFYNRYIESGMTYGSTAMLRILQFFIRQMDNSLFITISNYFMNRNSDLVVSLIPNFNIPLYDAVTKLKVPFVTIMTDMADCPPNFWIEEHQSQCHVICGTTKAFNQVLKTISIPHLVSGMMVHPKFYKPPVYGINFMGWRHDVITALVSFGKNTPSKVFNLISIAENLDIPFQFIFVCGNNEKLYNKLLLNKTAHSKVQYIQIGFSDQLPYYMDNADFFIGKPGPGLVSEVLVKNLPVFLNNKATMLQEKYTIKWIENLEFGSSGNIYDINNLRNFIDKINFYKNRIKRYNNQAVFEVPPILNQIMINSGRDIECKI